MTPDLRQMRYVVEVAREGGISRAALNLHVAQQAVSQQIKAVETALGVQLFERTHRGVELTAAGEAFVQEARRALNAADRVGQRAQAAARGEVGTLRLAYTLATVYETLPAVIDALAAEHSELRVTPREVFAEDIERLLTDERIDVALAPHVGHRSGLEQRPIRLEPFVAAVAENHPLAAEPHIPLAALADETIELWPHTMSPGYYDSVVAACRDAGFEPRLDEQAAGSTVWGHIARGRGVGLVVESLRHQLPRGLTLLPLATPAPTLNIDLVWPIDRTTPAIRRLIVVADRLAHDEGWLHPTALHTASAP
ncbi:MAG TPA: LysR family transcriptional regulator [Acidimicrobiales bacterium]|nr:LysR family transcriptional regulator [Acidimicrobiales bacterium]